MYFCIYWLYLLYLGQGMHLCVVKINSMHIVSSVDISATKHIYTEVLLVASHFWFPKVSHLFMLYLIPLLDQHLVLFLNLNISNTDIINSICRSLVYLVFLSFSDWALFNLYSPTHPTLLRLASSLSTHISWPWWLHSHWPHWLLLSVYAG